MAASTTLISNMSRALREELSDIITNISPDETPFMSNIRKGKIEAKYTEWLQDVLPAAAQNAKLEGASASASDIAAPSRPGNYAQISAKWFDISDTMEAVDSAGGLTTVEYQTAKHLKSLALDIEYDLINTTASYAGTDTTTARKSCGLKGFITTFLTSMAVASTSLLTEAALVTAMQACWVSGGKVDMLLVTPTSKRKISGFNGTNRLTINTDASEKKIVSVVDYFECDFGVVRVYTSRSIVVHDTSYDWLFGLQKDKWEFATLLPVKVEKLARTGLSQLVQISTEYTLIAWCEYANFAIKGLYNV